MIHPYQMYVDSGDYEVTIDTSSIPMNGLLSASGTKKCTLKYRKAILHKFNGIIKKMLTAVWIID